MRLLLYMLLFCITKQVVGQTKNIYLPITEQGNTHIFWYQWKNSLENKISLKPLEQSPHPFHFRMSSTNREIVDVWQQNGVFRGNLTEWVKDGDDDLRPFERFYCQQYTLSITQADAIGQLIIDSGILKLLSEENTKGWQRGLDGEEVILQYADNKNYYLKNYWTPSAQHDVSEALLIEQFRNELLKLANAALVWKSFQAAIPFRCFTNDNALTTCRVVSNTEYRQQKREVSQYVRQMKKNKNH